MTYPKSTQTTGFYVTARNDVGKGKLLLGPYSSGGEAKQHVDRAIALAAEKYSFASFAFTGVSRVSAPIGESLRPGGLNTALSANEPAARGLQQASPDVSPKLPYDKGTLVSRFLWAGGGTPTVLSLEVVTGIATARDSTGCYLKTIDRTGQHSQYTTNALGESRGRASNAFEVLRYDNACLNLLTRPEGKVQVAALNAEADALLAQYGFEGGQYVQAVAQSIRSEPERTLPLLTAGTAGYLF